MRIIEFNLFDKFVNYEKKDVKSIYRYQLVYNFFFIKAIMLHIIIYFITFNF